LLSYYSINRSGLWWRNTVCRDNLLQSKKSTQTGKI